MDTNQNGRFKMADSKWRIQNGGFKMVDSKWREIVPEDFFLKDLEELVAGDLAEES